MRLTLRWQITLAFSLTMALMFLLLEGYLQAAVSRDSIATLTSSLLSQARLASRTLEGVKLERGARLQQVLVDLDGRSQCRLTVIAADGSVAGDSREDPAKMENHADRLERQQAIGQGWGSAVRHSATMKLDMLYLALALPASGDPPVVLRLSQPMAQVRGVSWRLRHLLLLTFALALVVVWLVGLLVSSTLTAPVQALLHTARRVAKGDLQARSEGLHSPDLGELARVFNSALDQLSTLIATSRRESRYYATILEQMSDAVVVVDQAGRVQFINSTFARHFGVVQAQVTGLSSDQVALNFELSALLQRAIQQLTHQHAELRVSYPEARILATAVTPLVGDEGEVIGAIGMLHDVTDLYRLDEVRREFVANASHELRTPAAGLRALSEALQAGALQDPEKGPRFVQQLVDTAERLTNILDDMLTLTRVERGRELLSMGWLSANKALSEAADQIRLNAGGKGINVLVEVGEGEQVYADAGGLHTILINLLDNAVKYTPEGGQITLRGRVVPEGYEMSVSDTGLGIPAEHISRIFERFYRVDKARDRATGGTGLGLAIVKHIVEAHGGKVAVRSTPGTGSTFTVFLPNARSTSE